MVRQCLMTKLQSWPKLCGTSLQNALPRPSISFSHGNKRSLGQILPSHAMLFVRKGLPKSRPTLHPGGRGSERILQQFGKKHFVPHILARIVAQGIHYSTGDRRHIPIYPIKESLSPPPLPSRELAIITAVNTGSPSARGVMGNMTPYGCYI